MTIGQAIGLCPTLIVCEPDPVYYDDQFVEILHALSQVSPVVEPVELGRVFVGVDGLERLYGGPEQQLEVIRRTVTDTPSWAGIARIGWGRGKFAAWVAASRAKPGEWIIVNDSERLAFLSSQPLAVLPLDGDSHRRLWQLGLRTLGDLSSLPEEAAAAQFGRAGREAWRLAAGLLSESVTGVERPEPIGVEADFPVPLADRELLTHAMEILLDRALRHPRRIGWRVRSLRLRAALEQGASWQADVNIKEPAADRARLMPPLTARLSLSPPAGAVERLSLELTGFAPGTTELQLFAHDAAAAARAGRRRALRTAVNEIKTRLKRSLLSCIIEVHPWSRIPERRYALIDFDP